MMLMTARSGRSHLDQAAREKVGVRVLIRLGRSLLGRDQRAVPRAFPRSGQGPSGLRAEGARGVLRRRHSVRVATVCRIWRARSDGGAEGCARCTGVVWCGVLCCAVLCVMCVVRSRELRWVGLGCVEREGGNRQMGKLTKRAGAGWLRGKDSSEKMGVTRFPEWWDGAGRTWVFLFPRVANGSWTPLVVAALPTLPSISDLHVPVTATLAALSLAPPSPSPPPPQP